MTVLDPWAAASARADEHAAEVMHQPVKHRPVREVHSALQPGERREFVDNQWRTLHEDEESGEMVEKRNKPRERLRKLPPALSLSVSDTDGSYESFCRQDVVDTQRLGAFDGKYDRVDASDGRRGEGTECPHYVHRDVTAHLYETMPGLWVLSSVFAPGRTIGNAFCHHPDTRRLDSDLAATGAPLGPHKWKFHRHPQPRSRRGGFITVRTTPLARAGCTRLTAVSTANCSLGDPTWDSGAGSYLADGACFCGLRPPPAPHP